jgi:hypothetical protein
MSLLDVVGTPLHQVVAPLVGLVFGDVVEKRQCGDQDPTTGGELG